MHLAEVVGLPLPRWWRSVHVFPQCADHIHRWKVTGDSSAADARSKRVLFSETGRW
jgi:hypothetical protein